MSLKFVIIGNLVSLWMKIINSVVVVGLYYGFLTTFSIGPSYLLLLRAQVLAEGEEGIEKKVAATTGFIMGQLMMFISIYYTPLHLALGRPHTITALVLPYFLFHFFSNNHKEFDDESTSRNSIRSLSIQCVFLNNLIFQLLNHFILPSSMLARLVNIYMFRCNNKMLFLTSSFVGWLIGYIFFMKGVGLVLVWIEQNHSIRYKIIRYTKYLVEEFLSMKWVGLVLVWIQQNHSIRYKIIRYTKYPVEEFLSMKWVGLVLVWIQQNHSIRSKKSTRYKYNQYLVEEYKYSMSRIFSIIFFIICLYYLGRMPSPIFSKKLIGYEEMKESEDEETKESEDEETKESEDEETKESEDETDVEREKKYETKDEFQLHLKEAYSKNSPTSYSGNQNISKLEIVKEEHKTILWFERPLLSLLFDYKRWNRPTRYIKNNRFENAVRNETSQYFFYTCQNDGKKKISFTYPPSLSIFWEMLQRKISFSTTEKLLYDELYNYWIYTNEQKKNNLRNEFANRIAVLDKGLFYIDGLDKKTQLCNEKTKKEYLPKIKDPLLNGPYRAIIKKCFSPSIINETAVQNWIDGILINKIHSILRNDYNYHEFEQKKDTLKKKSLSKEIRHFMPLMNPFSGESTFNRKGIDLLLEEKQIGSEDQEKFLNFLVDAIIGLKRNKKLKKKPIGLTEISKKVPCWSYKLIDELEGDERMDINPDDIVEYGILSEPVKHDIIFTDKYPDEVALIKGDSQSQPEAEKPPSERPEEIYVTHYPDYPDFDREVIIGSMRGQRRKTAIYRVCQIGVHSPLFLDRLDNYFVFIFKDIFKISKNILNLYKDILNYVENKGGFKENKGGFKTEKEKEEKEQRKIMKEQIKKQKKKDEENQRRIAVTAIWDDLDNGQTYRSLLLVTQSILRKYIRLPLLIIAKNIVLKLFFNRSEWSEDWEDWKKEIHIKCTYGGLHVSEKHFPDNWLEDGLQIKILFPFYLKPWRRSPSYKNKMQKQKKTKMQKQKKTKMQIQKKLNKLNFSFLTVSGMETDYPLGPPQKRPSFFKSIFKEIKKKFKKELKKTIKKFSKNQGLKFFKEKGEFLLNVTNEIFIKNLLRVFRRLIGESIEIKKEKSSAINNNIVLIDESIEIKKEKSSAINNNIVLIDESIQDGFMNQTSYSDLVSEHKKKYLANRIGTIKTKIEKFAKEKNQIFKTLKLISQSNKTRYGTKNFESPQNIGQILKKKNTRLIRKSNILQKFFRERLFIDLFLYLINILRINIEFCLESTKNFIEKRLDNNEKIKERVEKKNKKKIQFIKPLLHFVSHINKNSKIISNLSFLSQAYVFYKLSQAEVMNFYFYNLKPIFQYRGTFLFLKNEIKENFGTQVITSSNLKPKKLPNSGRTQWKNWLKLKSNYQYDLSQLKWSQLGPKKWRNRVTEYCEVENKNLQKNKRNSDKKDQLLNDKNIKNSENYLLLNQKYNLKKNEKYNRLAYNFLFYENKKDSYSYDEILQVNKKHESFYTKAKNDYIFRKRFIDMWWSIPITNYLEINCIPDIEKNKKRKYFDWKIIHFCLRKKMDVEAWINISSRSNKNTKTETKNYTIVDKVEKFDWMGMNEELLTNQEFFPKLLLLYNAYKMKPWVIPINSLFSISQRDSESDVQENYIGPDIESRFEDEEFDSALKRYLLYQLRWYDDSLEEIFLTNMQVYCLLLRSTHRKRIALSAIKSGELNVDLMLTNDNLTVGELQERSILSFELLPLSVKDNGKFLFYQTISISLIHKSKHKKNQKGNDEWIPIPETFLSPRRRRKWRILMCLNSSNNNGMYRNALSSKRNHIQTWRQFFYENKTFRPEKNQIMKYKVFLWPNYRLEDLACMNRYWFDTNNGSRFSLLRIRMYPRLK
uniref:Ycf1 protein n=1 Tax=Silene olgiana TaxID=2764680 RepID=UPI0027A363F8|nr:Ycf1 protein [Silene olgiana]YP_010829023.1 hypothetical chloroplast RF19 [Silene olgiana]WFF47122.1 Ycf1 protein [Silene olgiana]WFF47138.1 hypothetical chloroplast RF19 [Silene olgiana]